ncbi:Thioredoxin domain-containing protein [Mycena indigotica]|uniref:Thioredoxin n=1 Tax=Mycena indigotica TaxID=2126181 RepID=A0A8H6SX88_9AGAR|nr:Thioredoxin domain-containing protein [Mycena indigotica]KAF7307039.1 Thioredoxin domain-containing protein [Mycena indigotica]
MSTITHVTSVSDLNNRLSKSSSKLTVIDFWATWCGPCHAIAPTFESLSKRPEYKNVNFFKVDTDAAKDVAELYRISAMPTFVFLKGSTKVDQVRGADRMGLESTLRRHAGGSEAAASGSFTGKGQTLGGGSTAPTDISHSATAALNNTTAQFSNLDPQVQILLMLIGAYAVFWYLS